jgi:hypothetical protein
MEVTIVKAIKNLKAARKDAGMVPAEEWEPTIKLAIMALENALGKQILDSASEKAPLPGRKTK